MRGLKRREIDLRWLINKSMSVLYWIHIWVVSSENWYFTSHVITVIILCQLMCLHHQFPTKMKRLASQAFFPKNQFGSSWRDSERHSARSSLKQGDLREGGQKQYITSYLCDNFLSPLSAGLQNQWLVQNLSFSYDFDANNNTRRAGDGSSRRHRQPKIHFPIYFSYFNTIFEVDGNGGFASSRRRLLYIHTHIVVSQVNLHRIERGKTRCPIKLWWHQKVISVATFRMYIFPSLGRSFVRFASFFLIFKSIDHFRFIFKMYRKNMAHSRTHERIYSIYSRLMVCIKIANIVDGDIGDVAIGCVWLLFFCNSRSVQLLYLWSIGGLRVCALCRLDGVFVLDARKTIKNEGENPWSVFYVYSLECNRIPFDVCHCHSFANGISIEWIDSENCIEFVVRC